VDGEGFVARVVEAEAPSVEHEASGLGDLPGDGGVDGVAEEGGADMFHVNPDLVSAAGVEDTEDESSAIFSRRKSIVVGDRGAS